MSRLPGVPLDTVWDYWIPCGTSCPPQTGTGWLASWARPSRAAPAAATGDQGLVACGLASFRGRAARGVSVNSALSLPALWADHIPRFLDGVELPSRPPVLLHTQAMRQHLLTAEGPEGAWRLSGLIDFQPAMRGEREYEFVGVGVFVAQGDSRFLTRAAHL